MTIDDTIKGWILDAPTREHEHQHEHPHTHPELGQILARLSALEAAAEPEPEPRILVDGGGTKEQAVIWRGTGGTAQRTDYRGFVPIQNGSHVIYESPGKTSLFEDCTFSDIRSPLGSDGKPKTFANDHIIYPGATPGTVLVRGCTLDATQLNGAAVHVYPASSAGATLIEITDTEILTGTLSYWALCAFRATEVVLRRVKISGPVRRAALEISATTKVTLEDVTYNGKALTSGGYTVSGSSRLWR